MHENHNVELYIKKTFKFQKISSMITKQSGDDGQENNAPSYFKFNVKKELLRLECEIF
jgi:hypothetical protein